MWIGSGSGSQTPLVFLDLSYYVFYRYFALQTWIKLSKTQFQSKTEEFEKYCELFENHILNLQKKFHFDWKDLYVCKDCPRHDVWRLKLFPKYKTPATTTKQINPEIFPYTYETVLPKLVQKYGFHVVGYKTAEADDVAGVLKPHFRKLYPERSIIIVTNDNDYLQLLDDHTQIINAAYKHINTRIPPEFESPDKSKCISCYTLWKIIKGDKSDTIPSIGKKIGDKVALKLVLNKDLLCSVLDANPEVKAQFELNKKLMLFSEIPDNIQKGILKSI